MTILRSAVLALAALLVATSAHAEPVVRIAVLKFGTVNWLMETISARGLDRAHGIRLEAVPLAGKPATSIAFQAGDVDIIVTDWIWALYQRARGVEMGFAPFSNTLGALMTRGDVADACDLKGHGVGVVGGELDKSWLVLQALVAQRCGFDLARETQALYGAPPLMSRQLESGAVDAVSTYWAEAARLEAAGMTRLVGISDALAQLGIVPTPPMIGFVWDRGRTDPAALDGFLAAAADASRALAEDDAAWESLRSEMGAKSEVEFTLLRDAYRSGIPKPWTQADTEAARRLYELLVERGGKAFAAEAGPFDPAIFPGG